MNWSDALRLLALVALWTGIAALVAGLIAKMVAGSSMRPRPQVHVVGEKLLFCSIVGLAGMSILVGLEGNHVAMGGYLLMSILLVAWGFSNARFSHLFSASFWFVFVATKVHEAWLAGHLSEMLRVIAICAVLFTVAALMFWCVTQSRSSKSRRDLQA